MNPFVKSKYPRHALDHYPTIDERCLRSLLATWVVPAPAYDPCCGPNGESSLVHQEPYFFVNAGMTSRPRSIITNPPYARGVVDGVVQSCIDLVNDGTVEMAACLLRTQWDHAAGRAGMFAPPFAGLVRLRYRPWWSEDRKHTPIHSYQWIIWDRRHAGEPVVRYAGAR